MKKITIIAGICLLLDQIVKFAVQRFLSLSEIISIVPDMFYLTNVRNYGGAWSVFSGERWLFIFTACFALGVIYYFFIYRAKLSKLETIGYGILFGGILGNLIDRIFHGYVIDYIGIILFGYHYPIFNFADICIVVSVGMILYQTWKESRNDESESNRYSK